MKKILLAILIVLFAISITGCSNGPNSAFVNGKVKMKSNYNDQYYLLVQDESGKAVTLRMTKYEWGAINIGNHIEAEYRPDLFTIKMIITE